MDSYIISKDRLLELLEAESRLQVLEGDGVDNWSWYMEGRDDFLREMADNFGVNIDDNENFSFRDLALLELEYFFQPA